MQTTDSGTRSAALDRIRHRLRGLVLAAATVLALAPAAPCAAAETAFVNVNVVAMTDEAVQAGRTVVVRDGLIAAIGDVDATAVAADATIIDGTDRYLIPGLTEMHAHVPGASSADLERVLTLFVVNGVTSLRGMLGQPSHLGLRASLEEGELLGPRLYTSGPSFNGSSVQSPRQAADMVEAQHAAGYDFLKVHPGLTRQEFSAMATVADELGIRFAGHVPADVGLSDALARGIATIDHLDGYMQALVPPQQDPSGGFGAFFGLLLASAADAGRIDAKQELLADPAFDAATAARAISLRRQLIKSLNDHGAELLLGSDAPQVFNVPGFSLHRELALLVAAGLTPYEALRTGTVNAARWFGAGERRGTIEAGKEADLVLLDDDPLRDIANTRRVHGVMLRGRWLDRAAITRLLEQIAVALR